MSQIGKIGDHLPGAAFLRAGYDNAELTQFVHLIRTKSPLNFSMRVLRRAEDLGLNFIEMDRAIADGNVLAHEVGPSKTEIRMEIQGTSGDIQAYRVVVYLSKEHDLFAEDIRDTPIPRAQGA